MSLPSPNPVSQRPIRQAFCLRFLFFLPCLFLLGSFSGPHAHAAEQASINNLILINRDPFLEMSLRIEGAFTPEIQTAVQSGIPVTFSYYLILESPRRFWLSRKIADITLTHTLLYNAIREDYTVTRSLEDYTVAQSLEDSSPYITKDFEDAKLKMSSIYNFTLAQTDEMKKGDAYRLKAKAKLREVTLPLYLHQILFFLAFWDFETDWYSIDFTF